MRPEWGDLLERYVRLGGTLVVESVPGWGTDRSGGYALSEWEAPVGNSAPGTIKFGELSGIKFNYYHRGAVTKIRILQDHPLTAGLEPLNEWIEIPYKEGDGNYGYLAYPVVADDATVLIEAEHEQCRYDGISYKRRGKITGVHPLVTIKQLDKGTVIRQYAHVSLPGTMGGQERYETFADNLAQYVKKLYNERDTK